MFRRAPDIGQYAPVPVIPGTDDRAVEPARIRLAAAGAAVVIVGAGLGLRAVAAGGLAKYGGDALYTVLLLALVVLVAPRVTPLTAAGSALAASWGIEFLQLSGVAAEFSQRSAVARLVLGSTFNPPTCSGTRSVRQRAGSSTPRWAPTCHLGVQEPVDTGRLRRIGSQWGAVDGTYTGILGREFNSVTPRTR